MATALLIARHAMDKVNLVTTSAVNLVATWDSSSVRIVMAADTEKTTDHRFATVHVGSQSVAFFLSDVAESNEIYHGDTGSRFTLIVLCPTDWVTEMQRRFTPQFCAEFFGDIAKELLLEL
jgi:hypothetical protein